MNNQSVTKSFFLRVRRGAVDRNPRNFIKSLTWEQIDRTAQITIAKSTNWALLVIPLLAAAYHLLSPVLSLGFLEKINFPHYLLLIYFASVLFSLGRLVYEARCPEKIRKHRTLPSYVASLADFASKLILIDRMDKQDRLHELTSALRSDGLHELNEDDIRTVAKAFAEAEEQARANLFAPTTFLAYRRKLLENCLDEWASDNTSQPMSRLIVSLSFATCALVAAYITFLLTPLRVIQAVGIY